MKSAFFLIAVFSMFLFMAAPALALSTAPGPVDSSGSQLTDPDEGLEALSDQSENSSSGSTAMGLGDGVSVWMTGSNSAQR